MRRLLALVLLVGAGSLGLGSAFVLAGPQRASQSGITICHAPPGQSGTNFVLASPDAESILNGTAHGAEHVDDIIPPFVVIENGTRREYPGRNMNTVFPGGFTGAQILANNCVVPTGTPPVVTETVTTTETETVPVTVTAPPLTITLPGQTITHEITIKVTKPATTLTLPGQTTVVTVPTLTTTTVMLPDQTITFPPKTVTVGGGTVTLPPVTVTVPGPTHTVTGGTTTTVLTITEPTRTIAGEQNGSAHVVVTITTPFRTVTLRGRVFRLAFRHVEQEKKLIELVRSCIRFLGSA